MPQEEPGPYFFSAMRGVPTERRIEIVHQLVGIGVHRAGDGADMSEALNKLHIYEFTTLRLFIGGRTRTADDMAMEVTAFLLTNPLPLTSTPERSGD